MRNKKQIHVLPSVIIYYSNGVSFSLGFLFWSVGFHINIGKKEEVIKIENKKIIKI